MVVLQNISHILCLERKNTSFPVKILRFWSVLTCISYTLTFSSFNGKKIQRIESKQYSSVEDFPKAHIPSYTPLFFSPGKGDHAINIDFKLVCQLFSIFYFIVSNMVSIKIISEISVNSKIFYDDSRDDRNSNQ